MKPPTVLQQLDAVEVKVATALASLKSAQSSGNTGQAMVGRLRLVNQYLSEAYDVLSALCAVEVRT